MKKTLNLWVWFFLCAQVLYAQEGYEQHLVLKPKGHKGLIQDLCLSADGTQFITAGQDKTTRIWDSKTYEVRGEFQGHIGVQHFGSIYAARTSPDGKSIATGGIFGDMAAPQYVADIRVFDFEMQKISTVLVGHENAISNLRWSRDSKYLVSGSFDNTVKIWDMIKGDLKITLSGHNDKVWGVDIFGNKAVSGSDDNLVILWDIETGEALNTSYDHFGGIVRVAFDRSGQFILTSATDKQINLYDADLNYQSSIQLNHYATSISFSKEGSHVVFGLSNGGVKIYSFDNGKLKELGSHQAHEGAFVAGAVILPDMRVISAGGTDSNIAVHQLTPNGLKLIADLPGSTQKIWGAGLNREVMVFSDAKSGGVSGLKDIAFTKGFNLVSRNYDEVGEGEAVYKMTFGSGFSERTAVFEGKTYDFKAPVMQLGGLVASIHGKRVIVKYEPPLDRPKLQVQRGKFINYQYGESVTDIHDNSQKYGMTFTPDSLLIIGGSSGYLKAFDLAGNMVTDLMGHEDIVFTVNMSFDRRWLITGSHDQSIRLWDADQIGKKESLTPTATCYFSNEGEWLVVTNSGYYMSSTKGGQYVGFHQNQGFRKEAKFYPFENFDLKYNRPDKVLEILEMGSEQLRGLLFKAYQKRVRKMGLREEDISGELNLPTVVIDGVSKTVTDKFYDLNLTAKDDKLMLDRINVYVNDIPIYGINGLSMLKEKNRQSIDKKLSIELTNGRNKIQVSALNVSGIESLKETVQIFYDGEDLKPDLHLVAIGVSNYKDSQYNLTYASKDANDISNLFFSHHQQYNKIHIHRFTDALAQREKILAVKEKLLGTKVEDEVILFMAGHGLLDGNLDYYFATQDIDFNNPSGRGLKYEELEGLLDGIPARKKLMLIDACHSGEVDKDDTKLIASGVSSSNVSTRGFTKKPQPVGMDNIFELMQELFADLRRGTGAMVISSASGVEFAFESADWKNGVFTYALIEGLKSGKCDTNKDKEVQISELKNYVFDRVSELTNGKQHPTSRRENLEFDFVVW